MHAEGSDYLWEDQQKQTSPEIITPIIHMNGSGKRALIDQLCAAYRAVQDAMDALRQASPNGRDYYLEPGRLQKAEAQYQTRCESLKAVAESLEAEADAIQTQYPDRDR